MPFPRVAAIRQRFPDRRLQDIPGEVRRELASAGFGAGLKPGARVAIGAGSRGITNIAIIVRAVVDYWKSIAAQPFVFPAMGTHGAATAEGQANVLANFGITAETMGCPIVSSLEVVSLGATPDGIETYLDRQAYESDGMMFVGRVKRHTDFEGKIESGLFKMMAIGLGKLTGAQRYHVHAYRMGIEAVVRSVGRHVLRSGKILGGLAVIEDEGHNTAKVSAVRAEEMERREEELLAIAKSWVARIPVPALDILIVDEIGKDISGTGFDTNIVGRYHTPYASGGPKITRVGVLDVTDKSNGNANGLGILDLTTKRAFDKFDFEQTYPNALTSTVPMSVKLPMVLKNDRQAIQAAIKMSNVMDRTAVRMVRIKNTVQLGEIEISENLVP